MATIVDELVTIIGFKVDKSGAARAQTDAKKVEKGMDRVRDSAKRARRALAGAFAAIGGAAVVRSIVDVNRSFESMKATLRSVAGGAEGAEQAFSFIREFATSTPFQVEEITQAFIRMKALGLDPTRETLTAFGNVASANGKSLIQFTEAVADAVTGEFERLKEFGIKASSQGDKVAFTFQGVTTTVGKNAQEIQQFLSGIGKNQFAGAMEEQMGTLNGVISNLQDTLAGLALDIGEGGLNDAIRDSVKGLKEWIQQNKKAIAAGAVKFFKLLAGTVRVAASAVAFFSRNWKEITAAFIAFKSAGVLKSVSTGLGNVAAGMAMVNTKIAGVSSAIGGVVGSFARIVPAAFAASLAVISFADKTSRKIRDVVKVAVDKATAEKLGQDIAETESQIAKLRADAEAKKEKKRAAAESRLQADAQRRAKFRELGDGLDEAVSGIRSGAKTKALRDAALDAAVAAKREGATDKQALAEAKKAAAGRFGKKSGGGGRRRKSVDDLINGKLPGAAGAAAAVPQVALTVNRFEITAPITSTVNGVPGTSAREVAATISTTIQRELTATITKAAEAIQTREAR